MTGHPRPALASAPFLPEFSETGALRQPVGETGRAHIDRPLLFLVLHRSADPETSIARHVAITSPAYLVWGPDDDTAAASAMQAIVAAMRERFGRILLVSLYDQEPPPAAVHRADRPGRRCGCRQSR